MTKLPTGASTRGVGPLIASALLASIGDAKAFKNGRQFADWLGLVPRRTATLSQQTKSRGKRERVHVYGRNLPRLAVID
ncbi:hypothetical protein E4P82_18680 [Candidatus Competibacter phosphatis]|uniref:Transposase IS116/IS110/IS902 C-terminal domain-containing protein n=1 Tax=Candidatus Competibacter phosphatis TaxID=221280 RepID=A0ABX1TNN0_9GAMM|nr:hypothetical protein [Candidatus Competibacter phosphatis]